MEDSPACRVNKETKLGEWIDKTKTRRTQNLQERKINQPDNVEAIPAKFKLWTGTSASAC